MSDHYPTPPTDGAGGGEPPQGQPGYGQQGYGQQGYGQGQPAYPGYGYVPPARSNGLGLAGMILGIVAIPFFSVLIPAILAIIFGFIGRARAKRGDADNGGQALAGIILGFVGLALFIGLIALAVAGVGSSSDCTSYGNTTTCTSGFNN